MRNYLITFLLLALFVSCGSSGKKQNDYNNVQRKYVTIVDNVNGYSVAYTEDGHTIIYKNDSVGDIIAYYLKFDDNAEKYGQDRNSDQIVRVEMDSSLNVIKSIISVYGGAFCEKNNMGYNAYYFDENIKDNSIECVDVPLCYEQLDNIGKYREIKKITLLLNDACAIARSINDKKASGWYNIVSALEPSQNILSYDVIEQDTICDPIICKHISKIEKVSERYTFYYFMLQEKMISKKVNNK